MSRLLLATIFALSINFGAHADTPDTESTEILKAWVPIGFDNNDKTQVVVDGLLPNTCFKLGPYTTRVDAATKTIRLQQNLYHFSGMCLQMIIPFTQTLDIGLLEAGDYKLVDEASGKALGVLPVTQAKSPNIDDFLYANMREVHVGKNVTTGQNVLTGSFDLPTRCATFRGASVHYYPEVIVVQPLLNRIGTAACGADMKRLEFQVNLKPGLKGTYLLHVRSMSGQAINRLVELE
jgi:hypothetical protein